MFLLCFFLLSLCTFSSEPVFGVTYHPYGVSQLRDLATPHPDYVGWTDARMERDLQRIHAIGFELVLVMYRPGSKDADRLARVRKFHGYASNLPGLQLQLVVDCFGTEREDLKRFFNACAALNLQGFSSSLQSKRKPVLFLHNAAHIPELTHPALAIRRFHWTRPIEIKRAEGAVTGPEATPGRIILPAGLADRSTLTSSRLEWTIQRRKGRSIARAIDAAGEYGYHEIIVDSWNDYHDGSFVEPNLFDGDAVSRALQKKLAR